MPTTYNTTGMTLECGTCGRETLVPGVYDSGDIVGRTFVDSVGNLVTETFRFVPRTGRFLTTCRRCETQSRQARARRGTRPRIARTTTTHGRNATRKFGVELELKFPSRVDRADILTAIRNEGVTSRWTVKSDCSIRGHGWEVVSPPLVGEDGLAEVKAVCDAVRSLGAEVDTSTGLHVHHEIRDLDLDSVKRFYRGWHRNQTLTDGLVAPSRRATAGPTYCQPLSDAQVEAVDRLTATDGLTMLHLSRYHTVNLTSFGRYGTVEIRQHQGTANFEKIRTWVLLGQALLDAAHDGIDVAANTVSEMLNLLGDRIDETAKTFALGRAVEFGFAPVA